MKLISLLALSFLSSCCALHKHAELHRAAAATQTANDQVSYKVIPLRFAAAGEMAGVLRNSVGKQGGRQAPQFIADERTNSVVVSCAAEQLPAIEKLIAELDVEVKQQQ